jgi:hypothetical protein
MSIVFSIDGINTLIKERGRFSIKNKGGIAMFKQESITESPGIHAVWKPWLFGLLASRVSASYGNADQNNGRQW